MSTQALRSSRRRPRTHISHRASAIRPSDASAAQTAAGIFSIRSMTGATPGCPAPRRASRRCAGRRCADGVACLGRSAGGRSVRAAGNRNGPRGRTGRARLAARPGGTRRRASSTVEGVSAVCRRSAALASRLGRSRLPCLQFACAPCVPAPHRDPAGLTGVHPERDALLGVHLQETPDCPMSTADTPPEGEIVCAWAAGPIASAIRAAGDGNSSQVGHLWPLSVKRPLTLMLPGRPYTPVAGIFSQSSGRRVTLRG